jgi:S-adenosyl-L-methionine hydrolase (adenosine-forming)
MITLTTDFGLKDPYVAEIKGVMLSINPKATIIDVTHEIEKFSIRMGAFVLASAVPYFPVGTVHLAVVDPGVGTDRRAIVIQTKKGYFVGPDNGLLLLAAQNQGIQYVYELSNPKFRLPIVSGTFHGRDVFAPAAVHLDSGVPPEMFGREITDVVTPKFVEVTEDKGVLMGEILHIDGFGNLITNINQTLLPKPKILKMQLPQVSLSLKLGSTYAETKQGEVIVLVGSHGFLEIALNQASAAEKYTVKVGDTVEVSIA